MTEEDKETGGEPTEDQGRGDADELDDFLREFAEYVEPEGPAEGSDFLDIGLPTAAGMARSAADASSAETPQEGAAVEADDEEGDLEGTEVDIGASISLRQLDSLLEGDVVGASLPDDRVEELQLEDIVAEVTEELGVDDEDVAEPPSIPGTEGAEVVDAGDEIDLTAAIMSAAGLPMPVEEPEAAEAEPEETAAGDEPRADREELEPVGVDSSEAEAISAEMISDASDVAERLEDEPVAESDGPDLPGVAGEQEILEVGDEVDLTDAIMQAAESGPAEEAPAEADLSGELSQEEIDALMSGATADAEPEAAPEAAIPDEGIFETESPVEEIAAAAADETPVAESGELDQAEIDSLLGGALGEPVDEAGIPDEVAQPEIGLEQAGPEQIDVDASELSEEDLMAALGMDDAAEGGGAESALLDQSELDSLQSAVDPLGSEMGADALSDLQLRLISHAEQRARALVSASDPSFLLAQPVAR